MKKVYLLRHGERDANGALTENAEKAAMSLGKTLPNFSLIISSTASRAIQTATLLTGKSPMVDERAGFYAPAEEKSREIYQFGITKGINFFDATERYQNAELADGVRDQALDLLGLIDEILSKMKDGQNALIVSHDLPITVAMAMKGMPKVSSNYLSGYQISEKGVIKKY